VARGSSGSSSAPERSPGPRSWSKPTQAACASPSGVPRAPTSAAGGSASRGGSPRGGWLWTKSRWGEIMRAMALYELRGVRPTLGRDVFVAEGASVIGDVTLGDDVGIWFGATLRGDYFPI